MKEWLKRRIKKAGENIESTLTQIFFLVLFGGSVAILAFSKKALNFVLQLLNTSTPLWASISLILLCGLYTSSKLRRHQGYQNFQGGGPAGKTHPSFICFDFFAIEAEFFLGAWKICYL